MIFFERELRKIAEFCESIQNPKFVGRSCIFQISDNVVAKMRFATISVSDNYEALKIELINRNDGNVDTHRIRFSDVWGNVNSTAGIISPHAWTDGGETDWYGFTPTLEQYISISLQVDEYIECFQGNELDLSESEGMTM